MLKKSKELKQRAVKDYLSGNYSQFDILAKYGISSLSVFKNLYWSYKRFG